MAPRYESDEDRRLEMEQMMLIEWLLRQRNDDIRILKNPEMSPIDWRIEVKGKVVAQSEYKRRFNDKREYPTYRISLNKNDAAKSNEHPVYLIVKWNDCTEWTHLDDDYPVVEGWGRTDRGDPNDITQAIDIPLSSFKLLEELMIGEGE